MVGCLPDNVQRVSIQSVITMIHLIFLRGDRYTSSITLRVSISEYSEFYPHLIWTPILHPVIQTFKKER